MTEVEEKVVGPVRPIINGLFSSAVFFPIMLLLSYGELRKQSVYGKERVTACVPGGDTERKRERKERG